jgi:predicted nucleic acid-binding Zn ribbon protein
MSASAFSFKGSGFYVTDYGGKSQACISAGDKGEKSDKPAEKKPEACATCPANKAA